MQFKHLALLVLLFIGTSISACAVDNKTAVLPQYEYQYSDELADTVTQTTERAIANDKLLLLVLGAHWCHDSRGLASSMSTPEVNEVVQTRFETLFIDVAYYRDVRWLTEQYRYPGYFATPSVMVIDPKTNQLLNMQTMPMWNTAHDVAVEDVEAYFATIGDNPVNAQRDAKKDHLYQQVEAFAKRETDRLFAAFRIIGPLMQQAIEDELEDETYLVEVAEAAYDFRMQLQKDIHALYAQVDQNDEDVELSFPQYPAMVWESAD
ncbi:hypothetical protein QTP81_00225 [Alteromonas sp. ASW11-36]|uniref:Thioredoxin family protein n=1 Tax=Alteromonas arenosi TaxID=3055817 RepID=A0ABT7SS95_9ALTE|nr:hypothetical protein [Alteromonas sp. ASW11-36]MDM7859026.1 hypothetical protein [Alteromonas sp. ASW11-36]